MNSPSKPGLFALQIVIALLWLTAPDPTRAQGQDSTSGERWLRIIAELLPGTYDNANQHYFDKRRGVADPDRHDRLQTRIRRISAPAFGDYVFVWITTRPGDADRPASWRIASLHEDPDQDDTVVMRHHFRLDGEISDEEISTLTPEDLVRTPGCDYVFRRRAAHFHGEQATDACRFEWQGEAVIANNHIQLSESGLWFIDNKFRASNGELVTGLPSGEPYWLERARLFHCYADIPGVGGGRDIPFERYDGITLHDKGGSHWFTTRDRPPREIGLVLQSVTWQVLNENNGNFNRDSLVLYTLEKAADGSIKDHGYAFTEPDASRIGNNLKWMLINCAITPRDLARPEL